MTPTPAPAATRQPAVSSTPSAPAAASKGPSAKAEYDYEAGEDNELSFPEGATITNIVSFIDLGSSHRDTNIV